MKYFIILAIFLAISVHTIVSQDPEDDEPTVDDNAPTGDAGNAADNTNDAGGAGDADAGDAGAGDNTNDASDSSNPSEGDVENVNTPGQTQTTDDSGNTPEAGNENSGTNNDTAPTDGGSGDNSNTTLSNAMKVFNVIQGLPAKCNNRYTACYGPDSSESDIKNKDIKTTDDDDVCELIEDGEDCVTAILGTFVCTDEEYEKVQDQACSGRRSAVLSVVLIGILSLISKILSQH